MKARVIVAACACAVMAAAAAPAQAAIAFRSANQTNSGSGFGGTQLNVPAPAGVQVDDVLVATVAIKALGNTIAATGAGWYQVPNMNNGDTAVQQATFYKVATATDVGAGITYPFDLGLATTRAAAGIVAYSGVDTANPIDIEAGNTSNGTSGFTATANAVITTHLRAEVIVATGWQGTMSVAPANGTAEHYEDASTNGTPTNNVTVEAADLGQATPGSAGPFSVVGTAAASGKWVAQTIALNEMPALTASFPAAYAWPALVPGTTPTSSEQTVSVTSNRAWGLKLTSDRSDGLSREWNGASYGALALASPLQWRTSSIDGSAQGTSFANFSGTAATAVTGNTASASAVAVGITFRQAVSYADEAALPNGDTYRQNVSYTAQQGF